jgi:hypothetical protein
MLSIYSSRGEFKRPQVIWDTVLDDAEVHPVPHVERDTTVDLPAGFSQWRHARRAEPSRTLMRRKVFGDSSQSEPGSPPLTSD